MNQNHKDVASERGALAVCIVVGLILFCINPLIIVVIWLIWLLITSIISWKSLTQGIWTLCFRCPDSFSMLKNIGMDSPTNNIFSYLCTWFTEPKSWLVWININNERCYWNFIFNHQISQIWNSTKIRLAIAPALIAYTLPSTVDYIAKSVWGYCFIRGIGNARAWWLDRTRYNPHTFFHV